MSPPLSSNELQLVDSQQGALDPISRVCSHALYPLAKMRNDLARSLPITLANLRAHSVAEQAATIFTGRCVCKVNICGIRAIRRRLGEE